MRGITRLFPEYAQVNLLLLAGLWFFLSAANPFSILWRTVTLTTLLAVQLSYTYWRITETLPAFEFTIAMTWMYLFFLSEFIVTIYIVWQCVCLTRHKDRSLQCDSLVNKHNNHVTTIDLFIPTYAEPQPLLEKTIIAAGAIEHSHLTVWICDDGNRPWLKALCELHNVQYLSRPKDDPCRTKAGNLNWSIPHGSGDYVLCLDADFQAEPHMATRLTALLCQKHIALVQAPQHFRNLDPVQRNLGCTRGWTEEQRFFFDISLPARDAWNNTLCVGSCWATRREVIEKIGGFPKDSVVEDVYFGYLVKSCGYKTAYLNEKLATGLAAEDAHSFVAQRTRWCAGAMTLLSAPHGPIRAKGLSLKDRLFYAEIPFYWLTHLHLLLLLCAPILYGFFGYNVFHCSTEDLFGIILPKCILFSAIFYWLSEGRCIPLITPVQRTFPVFQVCRSMLQGTFFPGSVTFKATRKSIRHRKKHIHWELAAPFIIIGILTTAAIVKTHAQDFNRFDWSDYSAYNAMLSAYSLITILLCCFLCVEKPDSSQTDPLDIPLNGSLRTTAANILRRIFR